jgi:hypothetical protein
VPTEAGRLLAGETWIRPHDGSAARLVDHVLAGHGDEPVETQVYVVAGDGVALAYQLNVIINPAETATRPLSGPAPVESKVGSRVARSRPTAAPFRVSRSRW